MVALSLAIMLMTGLVFGQLMKRWGLPILIGELIGGVMLGPTLLGRISPELMEMVFPATGPIAMGRQACIQIGLLCFLFVAGFELNVPGLRQLGRKVLWTSGSGIIVPFATGFVIVAAAPEY